MNINKVKLKVKALSLAAESRIIKKLEHGCEDKWGTNPIYLHRINEVRRESRATHLARAFLSGKAYSSAEASRKPQREFEFSKVKKRSLHALPGGARWRKRVNILKIPCLIFYYFIKKPSGL